jgi:hypothetical protein
MNPNLGRIFKEGISIGCETSFCIKSVGQISFDSYVFVKKLQQMESCVQA